MQRRMIPCWLPGLEPSAGVELGRFVLLDDVEANGETWFLARAMRLIRRELPQVVGGVSCSDPVQRVAEDGSMVLPGHVGTIYQAYNGRHVGRTGSKWLILDRWGRALSGRALSKIRLGETGHEYAYRALLAAGAPTRMPHEDGAAYVARALRDGPFRRVRHPGNIVYTWALTRRVEMRPALPFPKAARDVVEVKR
jgi:hypothetical protein